MRALGLAVAVLTLAACKEAPPPVVAAAAPPSGYAQGIDLARDARDYAQELKSSRLDFVARYYRDPASRWPTLTAAEAAMLSAAGKRVVAVWEWHSHRADYFTYQTGYNDALNAYRQAKAIGQPPGSAIYFAVDFNASGNDIGGGIEPYFRGVRVGLQAAAGQAPPDYRVGVYGSGAVCAHLKRIGLAEYAWLSNSNAWAGYDNFTDWNIKQSGGSPAFSFDHDINEAWGDYGGFQVPVKISSL